MLTHFATWLGLSCPELPLESYQAEVQKMADKTQRLIELYAADTKPALKDALCQKNVIALTERRDDHEKFGPEWYY